MKACNTRLPTDSICDTPHYTHKGRRPHLTPRRRSAGSMWIPYDSKFYLCRLPLPPWRLAVDESLGCHGACRAVSCRKKSIQSGYAVVLAGVYKGLLMLSPPYFALADRFSAHSPVRAHVKCARPLCDAAPLTLI